MKKVAIKRGQRWQHRVSGLVVKVHVKSGDRWNIIAEGERPNGNGQHKVRPQTLWTKFVLLP